MQIIDYGRVLIDRFSLSLSLCLSVSVSVSVSVSLSLSLSLSLVSRGLLPLMACIDSCRRWSVCVCACSFLREIPGGQ